MGVVLHERAVGVAAEVEEAGHGRAQAEREAVYEQQVEQGVVDGRGELGAEVVGLVAQVDEGDEVAEGDELIILESMKMEIPIEAPVSGTLVEFLVEEDDPVDEDQVVARIEE